jgi:hypothetical protein
MSVLLRTNRARRALVKMSNATFITETNPEFTAAACAQLGGVATDYFRAIGGDALVASWGVMPPYNLTVAQCPTGYVIRVIFQQARADGGTDRKAFAAIYDSRQTLLDCIVEATERAPTVATAAPDLQNQ